MANNEASEEAQQEAVDIVLERNHSLDTKEDLAEVASAMREIAEVIDKGGNYQNIRPALVMLHHALGGVLESRP